MGTESAIWHSPAWKELELPPCISWIDILLLLIKADTFSRKQTKQLIVSLIMQERLTQVGYLCALGCSSASVYNSHIHLPQCWAFIQYLSLVPEANTNAIPISVGSLFSCGRSRHKYNQMTVAEEGPCTDQNVLFVSCVSCYEKLISSSSSFVTHSNESLLYHKYNP